MMAPLCIPLTNQRKVLGVPKPLPLWEVRLGHYARGTIAMPMQWTTGRSRADRCCACCGFILRNHGLVDPTAVPACAACFDEVQTAVARVWAKVEARRGDDLAPWIEMFEQLLSRGPTP